MFERIHIENARRILIQPTKRELNEEQGILTKRSIDSTSNCNSSMVLDQALAPALVWCHSRIPYPSLDGSVQC